MQGNEGAGEMCCAGAQRLLCSCTMQTGGKGVCNVIVFIDPSRGMRGRIPLCGLLH